MRGVKREEQTRLPVLPETSVGSTYDGLKGGRLEAKAMGGSCRSPVKGL